MDTDNVNFSWTFDIIKAEPLVHQLYSDILIKHCILINKALSVKFYTISVPDPGWGGVAAQGTGTTPRSCPQI